MKNKIFAPFTLALSCVTAFAANRLIEISASERVQVFDEPGNFVWEAPASLIGEAQLLVVGGGGAGGGISGGGGGGGQVVYETGVVLTPGQTYSVVVADGGVGVQGSGGNGGDSSFSGSGFTTVTAVGGGGGVFCSARTSIRSTTSATATRPSPRRSSGWTRSRKSTRRSTTSSRTRSRPEP